MIVIEIADNPNCSPVDLRVFHDLDAPQAVGAVRLERQTGVPAWYAVTGWTAAGTSCPAYAQKVDDSGDGTAFLLHGGDAGVRLRPLAVQGPWRMEDPQQWGEPFLILGDPSDLQGAA
ncbi:MAG: hypothetical protein HY599_02330 [Candidatus Omnitrophica bacterium]|nr:hypothetical protein [Candidatus Omnitrophota bacterium]